jgi:hypothetical protein
MKGRPAMQTSPQAASISMPAFTGGRAHSLHPEDLAYQAMTVAAVLLVLGSLWVF